MDSLASEVFSSPVDSGILRLSGVREMLTGAPRSRPEPSRGRNQRAARRQRGGGCRCGTARRVPGAAAAPPCCRCCCSGPPRPPAAAPPPLHGCGAPRTPPAATGLPWPLPPRGRNRFCVGAVGTVCGPGAAFSGERAPALGFAGLPLGDFREESEVLLEAYLLCYAQVTPHLECFVQLWGLHRPAGASPEAVTKITGGMLHLPYDERLRELGICSAWRRERFRIT